jgi:hypothetical protein
VGEDVAKSNASELDTRLLVGCFLLALALWIGQQGSRMEAKKGYSKCLCLCCKQLFIPDPRSRGRQRFCSKRDCRKASKKESQQRWASKPENKDYWRGPEQVARVQAWRKNQPEYWRRAAKKIALQEKIPASPLQDVILPTDPLIIGLVSVIAGGTLQDKIAATCRDLIAKGCEVLQMQSKRVAPASQRTHPQVNPF